MIISPLTSMFTKALFAFAIFGLTVFASFLTVNGQTQTFAQFLEDDGSQDFIFTNNTSSANFNSVGGGSAIFFIYQNITGLDPSLQGFQNARLFITTTTTSPATINSSQNIVQGLNQTVTVQIIRTTPAPVGVGSGARTNLLTAVISSATSVPSLAGTSAGNSASLSVTTPDHNVVFSSDFLSFGLTTQRNLALSFSSVSPSFTLGSGSFLQSFTAAGSGTFASNPVPIYTSPTAASASINGKVLTAGGRGLSNSKVILTEANGTTHHATTGSFGNYEFTGIQSGQTVVVSVISKRYAFNAQLIDLQQNVVDLNFYSESEQ